MDHPGPQLSLLGGINIIGKLIFPNNGSYRLTINTAAIIVQGELDLQSTLTAVSGIPLIRIVMIGFDNKFSFSPVNENVNACPNFSCEVGYKSITVAGGKINRTFTSFLLVPTMFGLRSYPMLTVVLSRA
jgi:hypothetical protein